MRDYEFETLSTSIVGIFIDYHLPPLSHNHLEPKIIPLSGNFDLKGVFGNSLKEETSSSDSIEAFFYQMFVGKLIVLRS